MNKYFENPLYREAFIDDTGRLMTGFRNDYAILKAGPNKPDALKNIHRYAHSLKGICAMMELKESEQIAANLESVAGQALKKEWVEPDEAILADLKNGFAKIEELLQRVQDEFEPPATRTDAPA